MKAKLSDVFKPRSEKEIETILLNDIKDGNYSNLYKLINFTPLIIKKVFNFLRKNNIKIPRKDFEIIIQNLKYKSPEQREAVRQVLQIDRIAIMDRDPLILAADRKKARKMLIDNGFYDITTPKQEKNGSLSFRHPIDDKLEKEMYNKSHTYYQSSIAYIIYLTGAIRRSKPSIYDTTHISKMKVEDPFSTYEENAQYLINYMNNKKLKK